MEKYYIIFFISLFCFKANAQIPTGADIKSANQIELNYKKAKEVEKKLIFIQDSIIFKRGMSLAALLAQVKLKVHDHREYNNLSNFSNENKTYKLVLEELEHIGDNVSKVINAARKNPQNVAFYNNMALGLIEEVNEIVDNMKIVAMRKDDNKAKNGVLKKDSFNLLKSTERIALMEQCYGRIKVINQSLFKLLTKLETDSYWLYLLKNASDYHNTVIEVRNNAKSKVIKDIQNLTFF